MKKVGDLMKELGFREDASQGAKEAFIKHLIKSQFSVEIQTPTEKKKNTPQQLSFNFDESQAKKKSG